MRIAAALLVLVAGCAEDPGRSLAQISKATLRIHAWNDPTELRTRTSSTGPTGAVVDILGWEPDGTDCITLAADVTASLDGMPLLIESRGETKTDEGQPFCSSPTFRTDAASLADPAQLTISDATGEWNLRVDHLFANDFTLAQTTPSIEVVWTSAPQAYGARAAVGTCNDDAPIIAGNTITLATCQPVASIEVEADGDRDVGLCSGPAQCQASSTAGLTMVPP
jgi:hypothetical protein